MFILFCLFFILFFFFRWGIVFCEVLTVASRRDGLRFSPLSLRWGAAFHEWMASSFPLRNVRWQEMQGWRHNVYLGRAGTICRGYKTTQYCKETLCLCLFVSVVVVVVWRQRLTRPGWVGTRWLAVTDGVQCTEETDACDLIITWTRSVVKGLFPFCSHQSVKYTCTYM